MKSRVNNSSFGDKYFAFCSEIGKMVGWLILVAFWGTVGSFMAVVPIWLLGALLRALVGVDTD